MECVNECCPTPEACETEGVCRETCVGREERCEGCPLRGE